MTWRRPGLKNFSLYVIVDTSLMGQRRPGDIAYAAIRGGADVIQLRDKVSGRQELLYIAKELRAITRKEGALFIVNDLVDVALAVDADGVHLGIEDMSVSEARRAVKEKIIGYSTHNLKEAIDAETGGADYIGVGPIFRSSTKPGLEPIGPDMLMSVTRNISIPFVAIGGINNININSVLKSGAKRVAIASAVMSGDDVMQQTMAIKEILDNYDTVRIGQER